MSGEITLVLAFLAGLLSFLSPCVLPLIPSYLGILGGVGLANNQENEAPLQKNKQTQLRLIWTAAGFVLGFSTVFIIFGILISTTFFFMGGITKYINIAAGIIVIILGLNICFDFLKFLNHEKRPFLAKLMPARSKTQYSVAAAFVAGAAFGTGWTPCIGPVLTGIFLIAGQSGQILKAVFYLSLYSAGLAIPFMLAALFFNFFMKQAGRLRSKMRLIQRISGIILIIIGIIILSGHYSALSMLIH